jgi:hypothetical protein
MISILVVEVHLEFIFCHSSKMCTEFPLLTLYCSRRSGTSLILHDSELIMHIVNYICMYKESSLNPKSSTLESDWP